MNISDTTTVRDLAAGVPGATRVFENFGIDYCCCGHRTLADACQEAGLPVEDLTRSLEEAGRAPQPGAGRDWRQESLTALTEYIIDTHHFFTRQELDRLENLFDRVCSRHGENHPELSEAQKTFYQLKQDLIPHMLKEEQVLFPHITRMEESAGERRAVPPPFFGTVRNPVRMMMTEHDTAGDLLRQLRGITKGYTTPPDGCVSFQTLYQALAAFEADLHQHIHLENNLLFPRAIEMEEKAAPEAPRSTDLTRGHRCFGH
ncbi:MAG TPA: iron-sulfur cluster repair di-iron protein [Blastocatellia bacterium]|nr:iron-sulfur cluster repair di-iron protein [Blastocatellia bacterium]